MSRPLYQLLIPVGLLLGYVIGCNGTHTGNPAEGEPILPNTNPLEKITKVDILFVMDNSGSMWEEQKAMHRIVEVLVTGDRDNDGEPEFEPADSLHLGVVSTDLGLPDVKMSIDPEGKCQVGVGDDGVLRHGNRDTEGLCGNGSIDPFEECDGDKLTATCETLEAGSGTLRCDPSKCKYDFSMCYDPETDCGNGVIERTEQCDGEDLVGETCDSMGWGEGTLACDPATCLFDFTGCFDPCGNGVIDGSEQCEGEDLNGATCETIGLGEGTLACDPETCLFDLSGCGSLCGNGVVDGLEQCDGEDLNGETCETLMSREGLLACDLDTCLFDAAGCFLPCGNGVVDDLEQCDGEDLNGETCESLGLGEGMLACNPLLCTFNTTSCSGSAADVTPRPIEETGLVCKEEYPLFLDHDPDTGDPDQTAEDFTCMLNLGISGCGFEQPLEAGLKALWPSADESVTFFGPSKLGHGDEANAGFLREDSLLAVIVVTDEEDCSVQDTDILEHPNTAAPGIAEQPANLRCYYNPDRLYPIERYVDSFKALRPGREDRFIFGLIAGVPPELVDTESDLPAHILGKVEADPAELEVYYQEILDHPDMQPRIREDGMNLEPSCTVENPVYDPAREDERAEFFTKAYPPRRLVEVARGFGVNGVVQSICEESFLSPVETLILAVTNRIIEAEEQAEEQADQSEQ